MNNVWTGPPGLIQELMTAIGGIWAVELGIEVTLNNAVYSTYRPGLVARTTSEPFMGCGATRTPPCLTTGHAASS